MSSRLWILGAPDPEMAAIEALLLECGETIVHATIDGVRVHPGNAYRAAAIPDTGAARVYCVECARDGSHTGERLMSDAPEGESPGDEHRWWTEVHIDHHRPGDPGFGRPPAEFLAASSLGQVIAVLARLALLPRDWWEISEPHDYARPRGTIWREDCGWLVVSGDSDARAQTLDRQYGPSDWRYVIPRNLVLTAAADHCLGAAYRGECPGVDPDELMRWRCASRAAHQGRTEADVLADVEAAMAELRAAVQIEVGRFSMHGIDQWGQHADWSGYPEVDWETRSVVVVDMRRDTPVPELPEAAARLGIGYVSGPLIGPDGRRKFTCSGTSEQVEAWIMQWAPSNDIVDIYGDPARGFAGGYAPT